MHINSNELVDLDKVLAFAREKHKGHLRLDGSEYITHPIRVSELVRKYKPSSNANILAAGALLHDVLEDTYTSYRELKDLFGEVVASLVMEVTSSTYVPKLIGKQLYLAHKMRYMSSYALVIKLADRLDNVTDISALPEEKLKKTFFDTIYMVNYIENKRILTDAQSNLIKAIRERLNTINEQFAFTNKGLVQYTDIDQD
ncbi:MAG: HD domain-containing protein [Clostridiales bacterium]|nr:HD domain-containing protein [Clostridiales bacterium]